MFAGYAGPARQCADSVTYRQNDEFLMDMSLLT
jgi:hypothetical protein